MYEKLRAAIVAALLVLSMVAAGVTFSGSAVAETDGPELFEDFADGDRDGWVADGDDTGVSVVQEGFYGDYSLEVTDEAGNADVYWEGGPTFDMSDNFEVSGTMQQSDDSNYRNRVGIKERDGDGQALLVFSEEHDATYLATTWDENPDDNDLDTIADTFNSEWVEFRIQVDGGTVRAKVWGAGTAEPSTWQLERDFETFDGEFYVNAGSDNNARTIWLDRVDAGGNTISGQVTDQHGDPVPNATVDLVGADYDALEDQAEDLDAEADEILREIETIEPDEWDPDLDSVDEYEDADGEYVAVHTERDWKLHGDEALGQTVNPDVDLDEPRLTVPQDETVVLSLWDATRDDSVPLIGQDAVDSSLPGSTVSGEIVVTQLGPHGETMDETTYETEPRVRIDRGATFEKDHEAATANLPPGLYRVAPADNPERSIVISVGDPDELFHGWRDDLRDEHDQLTEHSENLNDRIDSGELSRATTTTDENGYYELNVPTGVEQATIIAYGDYGDQIEGVTGPSLADLHELQEEEQGAVYLTGSPQRTEVPADNVDLEVQKVDGMAFTDPATFEEWIEDALEEVLNETTAELETLFGEHLDEMDQEELEELRDEYADLVEENEELQEKMDELLDEFDAEDPPDDQEELIEEIEALEEAINELEESIEAGAPEGEIEDGFLTYEVTFPAEIDEDAVAATVVYQDGETEAIEDEYISVQQRDLITDDTTIVIDDYPVNDDRAIADVRVQVVTDDGFGESRDQIINPAFDGDIPALDAIDVSTDRPGPNERVGLSVRPEDGSGYGELSNVRAWNPDGEDVSVEVDGERARIDMDGEGVHRVEVEFENQQGDTFREVIQLRAQDAPTSLGPTLRVDQGPSGTYAIAGEDLTSAAVEERDIGGEIRITAVAPTNEEPSEIHVFPDPALSGETDTLELTVVEGDAEERVNSHVQVFWHSERLTEDTLLWWNGEPITHDGDTRWGQVDHRDDDKAIVMTFTDGDGQVEIEASHSPSFFERGLHRMQVWAPFSVPSLPLSALLAPLVALPAVTAGRRSFQPW